jgi:uncharacterized protein YceH (UPF0502 family)
MTIEGPNPADVSPPTAEQLPADPSLGGRVDELVENLRVELNARIDAVQAAVAELSAKIDAAQGQ